MLKDEIGIFHACLAQAFLGLLVFIGLARSRLWTETRSATNLCAASLATNRDDAPHLRAARLGGDDATPTSRSLDPRFPDRLWASTSRTRAPRTLPRSTRWREARALSEVTAAQIWLQMAHRIVALLIACRRDCQLVRAYGAQAQIRHSQLLATFWVFLLACQITLGAWTIWSNKAADIATAHVAVGATMLALGISISASAAEIRSA